MGIHADHRQFLGLTATLLIACLWAIPSWVMADESGLKSTGPAEVIRDVTENIMSVVADAND